MAVFVIPYTTPANYTYDAQKIEVSGGVAKILENRSSIYARYHLNEMTGIDIFDSSGNNRNGQILGAPNWIAGKLNGALSFNGTNQFCHLHQVADFPKSVPFTIECWTQKNGIQNARLIGNESATGPKGWHLSFLTTGDKIQFVFVSGANVLAVRAVGSFGNGVWKHVVATNDGSGIVAGMKLYVNGAIIPIDNIIVGDTGNTQTGLNLNIACQQDGAGLFYSGYVDEVVIYNRVLTPTEILYRYNAGTGRENFYFHTLASIYKTLGDTDINLTQFQSFLETLGGGNQGSIGYQLSEDGINWKYWTGSAWALATTEYNTQSVVSANIPTFPVATKKIFVRPFLISSGTQAVILDQNQITYSINQAPIIDAGSNKACLDHETISPFSDCTFSDPDGFITNVYQKVNGETEWTEILIGGYGTLLDAARAFQYLFDVTGDAVARLKVKDNIGAESEDFLTVTVSKYTVTFNVRDFQTSAHINDIEFEFNQGESPINVNSPFDYLYEYGPFNPKFTRSGYVGQTIDIDVTSNGIIINLIMAKYLSIENLDEISQEVANKVLDEPVFNHLEPGSFGILLAINASLAGKNYEIYDTIYTQGQLTSAKVRTYKTRADLQASINPLATFEASAVYTNEVLVGFNQVEI